MRSTKHARKFKTDEIGGAFPQNPATGSTSEEAANDPEDNTILYTQPFPPPLRHWHRTQATHNRLKAKQQSEAQLMRVSDELQALANQIRYLNPLMAELLDDAWDATEDAIALLGSDESWYCPAETD